MITSAITSAASALSQILTINDDGLNKFSIIEKLFDILKSLAELFNKQSNSTLEKTKSEDFLFSKDLSDKIKQISAMDRLSKTLKD
ncbi:hypothetical protein PUN28_002073 [Cardiocondyla obscurior]|uniref:Uncharacterized protein n=1 Tax=Cardiocondyla obscurior TaxID=286306 RepID=A0AAW2GSF5_9HYME